MHDAEVLAQYIAERGAVNPRLGVFLEEVVHRLLESMLQIDGLRVSVGVECSLF